MKSLRPAALLVLILAVAAALRVIGLGWGLRHPPHIDERSFVEYTARMIARGDGNHGFHEYPGLLFYLLGGVLAFTDLSHLGPSAYLAARAVVATFGVASVALVWRLARPLAGERAALLAAALVAVSPLEVRTAHMIRPDVVLETFALVALIVFRERDGRVRSDLRAGAALGVATAVKFSGVLLAPSYLIERLLRPGRQWAGVAAAAAGAVLAFAALSPYTLLDPQGARAGIRTQVAFHYRAEAARSAAGVAADYGLATVRALGVPGALLLAAGVLLALRRWRRWASLLAFPLTTLAVFSSADVVRVRFLIPTLGVLAVLAAYAVEELAARQRTLALAAALAAVALPLAASVRYVAGVSRPCTRDRAADWIEAHTPAGARVLTTAQADLGLDRRRLEVLHVDSLDDRAWLMARHVDLVAAGPLEDRRVQKALQRAYVAEPDRPEAGARIQVLTIPASLRPRYARVPLARARLSASESPERVEAVRDGDLATVWQTVGPQSPGAWLQLELPDPARVGRIELSLGPYRDRYGQNLHLYVSGDGQHWRRVDVLPGRPPVEEQLGGASQVLLIEPVTLRGLRLVQTGRRGTPWAVPELAVDAFMDSPAALVGEPRREAVALDARPTPGLKSRPVPP